LIACSTAELTIGLIVITLHFSNFQEPSLDLQNNDLT